MVAEERASRRVGLLLIAEVFGGFCSPKLADREARA
jgi:hypothetical protein